MESWPLCLISVQPGADLEGRFERIIALQKFLACPTAADLIAQSPERQKWEMQVQVHRSVQQSAEALAVSQRLADGHSEDWSDAATWLALVRKEVVELDERLSRQLLRLQSQSDRVLEVFVTSLEDKVAQVMSKQPMTEWRLAELSASVKGLQEQLELQARRGDACDARLQRWTNAFESELRKLAASDKAVAGKVLKNANAEAFEGVALQEAMLASLREEGETKMLRAPKVGADLLDDVAVAACNAFGKSKGELQQEIASSVDALRHELADVVEGLRHQLALEASKAMESVQDLEVRLATAEAANGASRAQAQRHAEQLEQLAASAERVCSQDRADGARAEASARLEPRRPDQVEAGLAELRSVLAEDLADLRARIAAETSARLGESRRLEQAEAGLAELRSAAEEDSAREPKLSACQLQQVETALAELQRQVAEQTSAKDLWREREEIRNLKNRMTQAEDRAQHSAKQLSQLEGRLVQVAEVSPAPVQQLAASVDELRSKMASTPWTQDIAALQERLATAEEAVEAAAGRLAQVTEVSPETLRQLAASVDELRMASPPWTQDIAALQERLATAEEAVEAAAGRLAQVTEVSPETLRQLTASVDELRSKMASTPWTQDIAALQERLATAEEAVEAATEAAKSASQDQAQNAEQLSQLEGRLVQVEEVSPEPVQQLTASVDELRSKLASTPWTQDIAALQERLAAAEEAVEAAAQAAKSASQDQAQKAEQLSQLEGRLVQVEEVSPEPVQQLTASVDELRSKMASTPWTQDIAALQERLATAEEAVEAATEAAKSASQDQAQNAEQLSQLEGRLVQVEEVSPEPVQQLAASVDELRSKMASTPWTQDIAALQERLATAEEAVEAATEATKSASQDQAQKAEQLSQLEGRLVQVEEVSPEPVQQLTASVDELRSKMASTPWTQDIAALQERLATAEEAVEAATEAAKSASQDQAQKAEQLSQLEGRLVQVEEVSPEPVQQLTASVDELRSKMASTPWTQAQMAEQLSQLEGRLVQVEEVAPEPVQQLTASVDELRSKMASTPWTQERLATAEEAVEAATEAAKSASQDQAQKAEQLSQLEGRLVQVEEVSPEPVQQLIASVDELRSKMASTPWTQDIAALQERLAAAEEAVEAATEAAKSASQDQAQKADRLSQLEGRLAQVEEVSPEPVQQLTASVDELRSKMASTPWTQDIAALQARLEAAEEAVEAASGCLAQVPEVSAEPVQLTASVDELRSKMASTPWTQDIAALEERLATAEEAVEAATEAAKSASQDQAQKAEQLSQLEGRLVQVEEVSPEPMQQLAASVDELRSKMASTPWTQDIAALEERLATAEEAVEAATEAAKSASQDQAQKAEQLSQLEGRLVQVEKVSAEPVQQLTASVDELRSKMASTPWTQDIAALQKRLATAEEAVEAATEAAKSASQDKAQKAERLSQLERRLAQVEEVSPEPVQQLTASVDELRSKMASTPWTQDIAALQERLATAEEAVQAAEAAKSASQDQAQKAEQLSELERRLAQVAELSPEPVQQLTASVDELRSKMASTPWTQDIAALQKRLATAEEAVGAATEAAKSASQDQAQKAEQLSQLERRLAQVAELSPEPVQQVTASVEELRARLELFEAQVQRFRGAEVLQRVEELRRQVERMEGTPDLQVRSLTGPSGGELKEELDAGHRRQEQRAEAREVEVQDLGRATESFASLLEATNQQLDAAVQKQDRLAAELEKLTSGGRAAGALEARASPGGGCLVAGAGGVGGAHWRGGRQVHPGTGKQGAIPARCV
ncbi:unnamed protein product [Effrenium voratum]|uniref:Uncharacterized protein n=1 Tax=Effrenium voratum TaxID=2562239 RepID=A0AA36HK92_9DINO|nr:unnamed protein product [Effrenium voratum]